MKGKFQFQKFLHLDMMIAVFCISILIAVTLLNAISRRFFNYPFSWQEEVQLWMIVWSVCFGSSAAFRTGSHVAIEMLVERFPKKAQRIIGYIVSFISIVVMIYLFYTSFLYVWQLMINNRVSEILKVPKALIYSSLPISLVMMIINITQYTMTNRREEKAE